MKRRLSIAICIVILIGLVGDRLHLIERAEGRRDAESDGLKSWAITLEEPTGIFRRDGEIVSVRVGFREGQARRGALTVISPDGQRLVPQIVNDQSFADGSIREAELLFPATIVPGERPTYHLRNRLEMPKGLAGVAELVGVTKPVAPALVARSIGVGRFEIGNEHYGVIINLGLENTEPGIVAAYNKHAGEGRMLNLIDTSPEIEEALDRGVKSGGIGTFLTARDSDGGKTAKWNGRVERIETIENGPYRVRVRFRLRRGGEQRETWEMTTVSGSPVLTWRTNVEQTEGGEHYGFYFSAISASPYEPFNRTFDGEETRFPDGWETDNPPDQPVAPRILKDLPGRHFLYYNRQENYGALGIFELDSTLAWSGIGARQFHAVKRLEGERRGSEMALSFPAWKGTVTVVEARQAYRRYVEPILAVVRPEEPAKPDQPDEVGAPGAKLAGEINSAPTAAPERGETVRIDRIESNPTNKAASLTGIAQKGARGNAEGGPGWGVDRVDLGGNWRCQWAEKSEGEKAGFHLSGFNDRGWREVRVPGTAHTQILEPAKVHTREAEWVSSKEWWYRRTIDSPTVADGERRWLHFEATDYHADVYLNGELIGRHEGYIDPWSIEVTDRLMPGRANVIAVRVWTPVSYYWRHRPYTVKGSYGAVDQKPDKITPVGITRPVYLVTTGPARIDEVAIDTRLNGDGSADVIVDLTCEATGSVGTELEMALRPHNFEAAEWLQLKATLDLQPGQTKRQYRLHLDKPALWWTWDHGKPNLYQLKINLRHNGRNSDTRTMKVGVREIEHIDWKFYLNGKRFFVRGTNSYYNLFLSEVGRSDYERDLELMRSMNINMIRLHCHFSNPEFYDLSDELGILIFQDYLEAWYPEDRAFSLKAARLYDPLIKYVRNHPSIAVWATSDEESLENYRELTKHLEPRLYLHDPQRRPVVRSTGRYGDAHVYEGWYGGTIWDYTRVREKFISELGATALPNYESLIKFLPNHWPISEHVDDWVFHKLQITEAMRAWGSPEGMTLREYIPQTQEYVARLFQLAIERMRRLKYAPAGGILHFHAIDIWPSVTMAALDYYRQPTRSYYRVQRSFQMVLPSFAYDRAVWKPGEKIQTELWLINDRWEEIPGAGVSWQVVSRNGSQIVGPVKPATERVTITLPADSSFKLRDLDFKIEAPGQYILKAAITDRNGVTISENDYEFEVR